MAQSNHEIARAFFNALSAGAIPDELLTPDMTVWTTSSGMADRARFQYGIKLLASIFNGGLAYAIDTLTAEEDRVAAEVQSRGTLINGETYQARYVFMLRIRDGRIASVGEYADPGPVRDKLGPLLKAALQSKS
jgi:uncharacterized protein